MIAPGTVIGGDFRVIQLLGEGGMGAVYVAEQSSTASRRALKVMAPGLLRSDQMRQRFVNEAKATSQIASDHVVQVVAAGVDPATQIPWLAMELLQGESLGECVRRSGPMHPAKVIEVVCQLCHALEAAHRVGIVHRDLKPDNVFLAEARREGVPFTVKVLDFGIAKLLQETDSGMSAVLGTPLWMSPEQASPGASVSPATDIWAVGLMVFWMLTGATYWRSARTQPASLPGLMRELLLDPIEPASVRGADLGAARSFTPAMDSWLATCLDRNPARRFPTATACKDALVHALSPQVPGLFPFANPQKPVQPAPFAAQVRASPVALPQRSLVPHVAIASCGTVLLAVIAAGGIALVFGLRAGSSPKGITPSEANEGAVTTAAPATEVTSDFDRERFDPQAFLPRANAIARQQESDARLVMVTAVAAPGATSIDLVHSATAAKRYVVYGYRSDKSGPHRCMFTILVHEHGTTVSQRTGGPLCAYPPIELPKCSLFKFVERAVKAGFDARDDSIVTYQVLNGSPTWVVGSGGQSWTYPDECP